MITKGRKSFLHGRVDIRAKLPEGQGIWPALWMLGDNIDSIGWPACGEIDIMEMIGHQPGTLYGTMHWGDTAHHSKGNSLVLSSGKFNDEFHVFSLLWELGSIKLLLDNSEYFTLAKNEVAPDRYPFDEPQFFIFNVAVGGNWPGSPDASTVFPQRMIVDYLRVFQKN
jgi:beta-glucanase (GH16 family)